MILLRIIQEKGIIPDLYCPQKKSQEGYRQPNRSAEDISLHQNWDLLLIKIIPF